MNTIFLALLSYILDRLIGEYKYIMHPVVIIGKLISYFEKYFYKDSIVRGGVLVLFVLSVVFCVAYMLFYTHFLVQLFFTTSLLASKSLYDSVLEVVNKPLNIKFLVSRDTHNLTPSQINKASIETYAENLNDGVIAPLFYLILFGIIGIFLYKAINTLDSMVGYKTQKYINFGKIAARLDDIANFIPSRITAILIIVLNFKFDCFQYLHQAKGHLSPNAGYPICAMGCVLEVLLGGDTSYNNKIIKKPYFGRGKKDISNSDILRALEFQKRLDIFIIVFLSCVLFVM